MSVVAFHFTIGEPIPESKWTLLRSLGLIEAAPLMMLHDHLCPERHAIVEIRHVIIDQPEAA